ncbi:MAG: hypothetical protein J5862_00970 [Bacteroidales bacterium]|nr:hypothetical protein [Bacteroidales bacterium]
MSSTSRNDLTGSSGRDSRYDFTPAKFEIIRTTRFKYACPLLYDGKRNAYGQQGS